MSGEKELVPLDLHCLRQVNICVDLLHYLFISVQTTTEDILFI